jgi:hypothetical protein
MPKRQTHTTEQIIKAPRMVDEGVREGDVCRQLGIDNGPNLSRTRWINGRTAEGCAFNSLAQDVL